MSRGIAWRSMVVAAAAAVTALLAATPAKAAFPGGNGKIAFSEFVQEGPSTPRTSVFTVNPDGTQVTDLTVHPAGGREPAWSADGTKIAFSSARVADSSNDIWFMNADGSNVQRVTSTFASDHHPAWSPNGTQIAFIANLDGNDEIYVVNADGSGLHNVTNNRENRESAPVWSPDGTRILYTSRTSNFSPNIQHIWVMNADGTNQTQVTTGSGEGQPDWSPDGTKISYGRSSCAPVCDQHLYVANPDGTGEQEIPNSLVVGNPDWSPDGTKFVFGHNGDMWTMNADGTGAVQIMPQGSSIDGNDWGPTFGTGYPRPAGASPVRVPLVPAYAQCTAANRTHGPPLAFASCNPPAQTSPYLTVGTPDANGAGAASLGHVRVKVLPGTPGPPHDTQVFAYLELTDVRCTAVAAPCGAANAAGGADYAGELELRVTLRITDRWNSVSQGGGQDPATMTDYTLQLPMFTSCAGTASTAIGSTCNTIINLAAVIPGVVPEGKRALWEMEKVQVRDGGLDGDAASTADNELFLTQGVFIP